MAKLRKKRSGLPLYVVEDYARATNQYRLYFRAPGQPKIRLWHPLNTPEFWVAYAAATRSEAMPKPESPREKKARGEKTFETLCRDYYQSAPFKGLVPIGQRTRKGILTSCCNEETERGSGIRIGDTPLRLFGVSHVKLLRDRKGDLPEAANNRVKAVAGVFAWHLEGVEGARNPCAGLKRLESRNADGFHSWSLAEVAQFEARHPIGTTARLAFDLALYTTQRKSDIVRLGPEHIDHEGWLTFRQGKTSASVEMPIIDQLAESIASRPSSKAKTFLETSFGKAFTANGIGNAFREWCDEAGLPQCTMHGLRKATGSRLAELGCSDEQIAAILGHAPGSKETGIYTRAARRRILAGSAMKAYQASLPKRGKPLLLEGPTDGGRE